MAALTTNDLKGIAMADENMDASRLVVTRAEAKAQGLKRYWTGVPCKHGHIAERNVSNGICVVCAYEIEKKYKAAYPEKIRAKWRKSDRARSADPIRKAARNTAKRDWEKRNPGKVAEKDRRWSRANPERKREHGRRWREKNLEPKRQKVRDWRDANRHTEEYKAKAVRRVTQWAKDNPEGVRKNTHARRARKKGAPGSHTKEQLLELLKRQQWKCADCSASLRKHRHLDHIFPLSDKQGRGSNDIGNLQYLCPSCNCRKHDKDPIVWARENGRLL